MIWSASLKTILFLLFLTVSAKAARKTEWSLHLDAKTEATYFPEIYGEDTNNEFYKLELVPTYNWKYLESIRFNLKPTFVANPGNKSEEERYFLDLTEGYIRYQNDSLSIQLGNNIISWGVTDGYNPLDIINSKQYFDPLHSRKLGALSLVLSQAFDTWDYDLIFIPESRGAILPGTQSRWLPRSVFIPQTVDNDVILQLPENLRYTYSSRENLDDALKNNAALRIQRHGSFLDLGLSYFEGVASFPLVQPVVTGSIVQISPKTVIQVDPDIMLNLKNYRVRQGGLTLVTSQWDFLFKYETAYTQSIGDNPLLPGWTHENVLGLEKTFNLGKNGLLIAILQHSFISSERQNESNFSYTEIFRKSWMLGGKLTWKDVWNYSVMGFYDEKRGSNFLEASIGRRFFDQWVATLSTTSINGASDTPLGVYEKNDSYTFSISTSY